MLSNTRRIIAIIGPTCTGKSALSVDLAKTFHGEIVNGDSMQVYRHFDIGTAKPDAAAMNAVPHHIIDIIDPSGDFQAALFRESADRAIGEIWSRNRVPIVVGGTGLYMKALIYGLFEAPRDSLLRGRLHGEYNEDPLGFYERVKEIDKEYALRISHRDRVRLVRAMEVYTLTGRTVTSLEKDHGFRNSRYNALKIGLQRDRDELYSRIDRRVEEMLDKGWVEEVKDILSMGYSEGLKPFSGIGYREILLYIKGFIRYEDMVKDIKKHTRHYAKRQFTWFAKEKGVSWFQYPEDIEGIFNKVREFL
ncbi:MAG TPA: tRNA (adenosine(37)-N6)-dimethylallyltransferase MiaA [Syntrophorhabdaceae bacterium]|nr:tRNA (adenosine(37)-N6)-dimethylallyltransferase MiaA [Syntrophorhabdaceae bacterium]HQM80490.1 tRNA (adenosine(37)-N6)-dimethylallyltransferase MiaA [Syntrophorhabdaceae bacterium]